MVIISGLPAIHPLVSEKFGVGRNLGNIGRGRMMACVSSLRVYFGSRNIETSELQMSIEEVHCPLFKVLERPTGQGMRLTGIAHERDFFSQKP